MRFRSAAVLAMACVATSFAAQAQSSPSEDQIINGLRPDAQSLRGPTRGIRPAGMPPPVDEPSAASPEAAAPAAARTAQVRAHRRSGAPSIDLTVNFVTGSSDLTPSARHTLDTLGRALTSSALSAYRFRIEGHTDTVGNPQDNQTLSEKRAQSAAQYLEDNFHIDPARLDTVGKGETDLAVDTPPQTPEPRNRRVKIVNLGS